MPSLGVPLRPAASQINNPKGPRSATVGIQKINPFGFLMEKTSASQLR